MRAESECSTFQGPAGLPSCYRPFRSIHRVTNMGEPESSTQPQSNGHPVPKRLVKLKSFDGEIFEVEEAVASVSSTVKLALQALDRGIAIRHLAIPLRDVTSRTLEKVIEYCTFHVQCEETDRDNEPSDEVMASRMAWKERFLAGCEFQTLLNLFWAAYYMQIKILRDITSEKVTQLIEDMSMEDFKSNFADSWVLRDMDTPEKEAQARLTLQEIYREIGK